jgi:hypothetical protein
MLQQFILGGALVLGGSPFGSESVIADVPYGISVYAADIDGDQDVDVVSASIWVTDGVHWHENTDGDGSAWTTHAVTTDIDGPHSVFTADVDADGDIDILSASIGDDRIVWYENSEGHGLRWVAHDITTEADHANDVFAADIDKDGDVDVISASRDDNTIAWFENTASDGSLWETHIIDNDALAATSVFAVDVDNDGDLDVIATSRDDDEVIWHENINGDGSAWTAHLISGELTFPVAAFAADVNGDGDEDVLAASLFDDMIVWFESNGSGLDWTMRTIATDVDGAHNVYAADLDADGDVDVLGAAFYADAVYWYENTQGNGTQWTAHLVNANASGASEVFAEDLNGDGALDAISVSLLDHTVAWYESSANDPPAVVEVAISGHNWSAPAYSLLSEASGPLPWTNLDRVAVTYDRDVQPAIDALTLSGTRVHEYAIAGFAYDRPTRTATWTLASRIWVDRLVLSIAGEAGGENVDLFFSVLPGDATGNRQVDTEDILAVLYGMVAYSPRADLNGSNVVDEFDLLLVSTLARILSVPHAVDPLEWLLSEGRSR